MLVALFLAAAVILVAFGGLLAAADAALAVVSRIDIAEMSAGSRVRRSLAAIADDPGAHGNAVNFVRVLSETGAAVLVTLAFSTVFGAEWWWTLLVSVLVMTAASFVLVGSSPRSVGRAHPRAILRFSAPLVRLLRVLLGPMAALLVALGNRVTPGRPRTTTFSSEEQLLSMVDEAAELQVLEADDRELIHSIFEWGDTVVREVMVPRTDMQTVDHDVTVGEATALFLRAGISRMPVVGKDADEVFGVLYLRDIVRLGYERPLEARTESVRALARPAMFVPESKKADDTLRWMQLHSTHLALVVDEYGGIAGLVTLEDLIEELVGDISDEYDRDTPDVTVLSEGVYRVSARLPTDELGDLFGIELDDEDVDSVGGLLAKELGQLPQTGSSVLVSGLVLRAERVEGRRRVLRTVVVERGAALAAAEDALVPEGRDRRVEDREDAARG
ncbi:MAG: HlyC/CorC family transporter [Micrococcales bacterium]|nr:HlyC/CorC family transporter [Micrococcales bacterium]